MPPSIQANELTTADHWDRVWRGRIRNRLPSRLAVTTLNLQRLLRRHVRPGERFLEIGCAPGKILAWVHAALGAEVAGIDSSEPGLRSAKALFAALNLPGDLRCEQLGDTSFAAESFDVVFSAGVIEHFHDPRPMVRDHLRLVRPGCTLLITVPNYRGLYGALKRHFAEDDLRLHNLEIMAPAALAAVVPSSQCSSVDAYYAGRLSPWGIPLRNRWPAGVAFPVSHLFNAIGLLQPCDWLPLCPMLVLEARKRCT